jgi:4-hydroxy-3-methylbut-2-enyl diphosphate reductase
MKIIVAEKTGFCWGVQRAVKMALDAVREYGKITILGDLIHNRAVIERLEAQGARTVESPDDIEDGSVLIRAHGISPAVRQKVQESGAHIHDGTCPFVARVQREAQSLEREGRQVIIIGKQGHPEVVGVLGHTSSGVVVRTEEEIERLPRREKVGVVAQTTEDRDLFARLCERIRQRFPDVVVRDTICSATNDRQEAACAVAARVQLMLVVGDLHSSNTTHLAEICRSLARTYHVTGAQEIDSSWLKGVETVGITAGASTPDWVIEAVIERLKELARDAGHKEVAVGR